jgi:hypothetical protein
MAERDQNESGVLLQEIFSSRMRAAVLGQMLPRPHLRYSLTELSRLLGQPISSLQHECYKLERIGLLTGRREGNTRRYGVVREFVLYRPLTQLVTAALGPADALRAALEGVPGLETAFSAGSFPVTGDVPARLVLIGDVPLEEIDAIQERASLAVNAVCDEIETVFYRQDDWQERLSQGSAYATSLINGPRIDLIGSPERSAQGEPVGQGNPS